MTINDKIKAYLSKNGLPTDAGISPAELDAMTTAGADIDAISYYRLCKGCKLPLDYFLKEVQA